MPWPQGLKRLSPNCQEKLLSIVHADRTANQHRWVGVIHQGARENSGQGTRQTNPVTSGEGVLLLVTEIIMSWREPQRNGGGDCLLKT